MASPKMRLSAISLFLMLAGTSGYAQSGTDAVSSSPLPLPTTTSPLNGNWNIAGNRKKKQFPLLSMHIQVIGTQVIGKGDVEVRCPNAPRNGGGGMLSVSGEIAPDGSFTLRNLHTGDSIQAEIRGRVPADAATTWKGEYTLSTPSSRNCPTYQETKSFTATPLAPLNGTFSGSLEMKYFETPPPTYTGPKSGQAKFTVTVTQGAVLFNRLKDGSVHFYLPLTGTIQVHGSSCFSHGSADLSTESTHGGPPSPYSAVQGDFVIPRFAMNDESQLKVQAVVADPSESGLSVFDARVVGGKCDKQSFHGMLDARRR